jgi:hypothetical protein
VIFFFLHLPHVGEGKIDAGIGWPNIFHSRLTGWAS